MWSYFAGGGAISSRATLGDAGVMHHLEGSSDWRPFLLPFFSDEKIGVPTQTGRQCRVCRSRDRGTKSRDALPTSPRLVERPSRRLDRGHWGRHRRHAGGVAGNSRRIRQGTGFCRHHNDNYDRTWRDQPCCRVHRAGTRPALRRLQSAAPDGNHPHGRMRRKSSRNCRRYEQNELRKMAAMDAR